jgi:hypothetical protein
MRWPSRWQHPGGYEGSETGHGTCSVTFRQVIKLTPFLETIVPLAEGQLLRGCEEGVRRTPFPVGFPGGMGASGEDRGPSLRGKATEDYDKFS